MQKISKIINKYFLCLSLVIFAFGLYYSFFNSPEDYLQGIMVRIMYIHVPSALLVSLSYVGFGFFATVYLFSKKDCFDHLSFSIAKFAILITIITLVTGSIWGRKSWGTFWVFDARLTAVLINFFILTSYFILRQSLGYFRSKKVAAIFAIFGLINQPIIKFSVYFWNTLHQRSSIFNPKGISIDVSMLIPLIIMASGLVVFGFWYINICYINIKDKQEKLTSHLTTNLTKN